ncbi:pyruvate formate-lyase activating enzyme [Desulfonema ishimotonii]|uniref:Pyruvate formate-lyase activating enzyme n=1 Tax=Desulfonema ishimotonii TaxID=45657 RepID=A0A401FYS2_9BACT|nr:DUF1786 family protein [Desulfonema ishimotonii]GBC62100.1 pyruvate formate-lyase activating enzyme [Desulfonema ishimotonii]
MSRFLMIDVGAGTMDVLYYDTDADLQYKAVVRSPVRYLAEQAATLPGNLAITGCEMGGGPVSAVLKTRAQTAKVVISRPAAATIHHDPERVRAMGIEIVEPDEALAMQKKEGFGALTLADLDPERIAVIVAGFGVPFAFDVVGVCAQDHGVAPLGISHLDYRHNLFRAALENKPYPHTLLYRGDEVPETMNRLTALSRSAAQLPAEEVYVMDSGMAAILGASKDALCRNREKVMVLDIATSHTVGAALAGDELAGFFEYHTHAITRTRLEELLRELADGRLTHEEVLKEGGHGAFIRSAIGWDMAGVIIATGPKRKLLQGTRLPITFGAPLGDNMMTGNVGLLEAIRCRKGLDPLVYI